MTNSEQIKLSRRERQIMDIIYELSQATAAEVHERLPEPPSYSAVRAMLATLESKGIVRHSQDGPRYVFHSIVPHSDAQQRAMHRILKVFFDDSPAKAVNAFLSTSDSLSKAELDELKQAIEDARKRGR